MYSPWAPRTRGKVILSLLRKAFACNTMALGLKDLRGSPQGLQTRWQREWNGMTLLSSPESFCFLTHSTKQPFHTHIPHFPTASRAQPTLPNSTHSPAQATDYSTVLAQGRIPALAARPSLSGLPVALQPGVLKSGGGRGRTQGAGK